jgi:phage-related protein
MTKVEFYTLTDGKSPVKDALEKLSDKQRTKILRQLKYLQEFGPSNAIPNNKKLTGTPLWELRVLGQDNLRIFYTQVSKNAIAVLHIFNKKKKKVPQKEINLALSRRNQIIDK